jgi:hypothetical protein
MRGTVFLAPLLLGVCWEQAHADMPVDVALVLATDISASVDAAEYRMQMAGLAAAIASEPVLEAIAAAPRKRIAVAVTQWSGLRVQRITIPWTIVDGEASADSGGGTSLSLALEHAAKLLSAAPPATRRVIDISTDGINNIGPPLDAIHDRLTRGKITVNGLAITSEWPKLARYLDENVITGTAAFTLEADGHGDYGAAMLTKLLREIRGPGLS